MYSTDAPSSVNVMASSTTRNIYGVFDMSGGAWEYMMTVLAVFTMVLVIGIYFAEQQEKEKLMAVTDWVMLDIKHMDDEKHISVAADIQVGESGGEHADNPDISRNRALLQGGGLYVIGSKAFITIDNGKYKIWFYGIDSLQISKHFFD